MKFWLSKNSEIPLREQLTRQIMLAIISGDLRVGEKLPSVREIALRYKIHQNTVSTAYRRLEENGWVEARQGSGVFVREVAENMRQNTFDKTSNEFDRLISGFLQNALALGFSQSEVKKRLKIYLEKPHVEKIIIAESDKYLRRILLAEIQTAIDFPVIEADLTKLGRKGFCRNALVILMTETFEQLNSRTITDFSPFVVKINSLQEAMRGREKPQPTDLIGIASGWEVFRVWAQTILVAAGIENESLLMRDTNEENWQKGLSKCAFIIADSATAQSLPKTADVRVFRLISESSLEELQILLG